MKPVSEFWLGLKRMADITETGKWELHVNVQDFDGKNWNAVYKNFKIHKEGPYILEVSEFDPESTLKDYLKDNDGHAFSTSDADNDTSDLNCALDRKGAWWYYTCTWSNLNGYNYNTNSSDDRGIFWKPNTFAMTEIKIKRT